MQLTLDANVAPLPKNIIKEFNMSISTKHEMLQLSLMRDKLYTKKWEAVAREYATNGYDAIISIGGDPKTLVIRLPDAKDEEPALIIRDTGPGLDETGVVRYITYLDSGKRDDVKQNGVFGLGSKSAFCVVDYFYIKSHQNGITKKYYIYKDESQRGKCALIEEVNNNEPNGLEVIIPVNKDSIEEAKNKMTEVASYFNPTPKIYYGKGDDREFAVRKFPQENYKEKGNYKNAYWEFYSSDRRLINQHKIVMSNVAYPMLEIKEECKNLLKEKILNNQENSGKKEVELLVNINNLIKIVDNVSIWLENGSVTFSQSRENIEETPYNKQMLVEIMVEICLQIEKRIKDRQEKARTVNGALNVWIKNNWEKKLVPEYIWNGIPINEIYRKRMEVYCRSEELKPEECGFISLNNKKEIASILKKRRELAVNKEDVVKYIFIINKELLKNMRALPLGMMDIEYITNKEKAADKKKFKALEMIDGYQKEVNIDMDAANIYAFLHGKDTILGTFGETNVRGIRIKHIIDHLQELSKELKRPLILIRKKDNNKILPGWDDGVALLRDKIIKLCKKTDDNNSIYQYFETLLDEDKVKIKLILECKYLPKIIQEKKDKILQTKKITRMEPGSMPFARELVTGVKNENSMYAIDGNILIIDGFYRNHNTKIINETIMDVFKWSSLVMLGRDKIMKKILHSLFICEKLENKNQTMEEGYGI